MGERTYSKSGPDHTYRDAIAFGILILVLLLRPQGILGKVQKEKV